MALNGMTHTDTVNLREFLEEKLESLRIQTSLRFDALDKALNLAREDAKVKYEHLNALRTEVTTDRGILVPKEQCSRMHKDLGIWMDGVNRKLTVLETRSITWTAAVGVFFLVITLIMRWFGK